MTRFSKLSFGIGLVIVEVLTQIYFRHQPWGVGNTGASFSFFVGAGLILSLLTLILAIYWKKMEVMDNWGWWMIIVGGSANLMARFSNGLVWDYLHIGAWLGFDNLWNNSADIMIVAGVLLLVRDLVKNERGNKNTLGR